jgi:hypothetical protein
MDPEEVYETPVITRFSSRSPPQQKRPAQASRMGNDGLVWDAERGRGGSDEWSIDDVVLGSRGGIITFVA